MGNMQILGDGHQRGVLCARPNVRIDGPAHAAPMGKLRAGVATPFAPSMVDRTAMPVATPPMRVSDLDRCP